MLSSWIAIAVAHGQVPPPAEPNSPPLVTVRPPPLITVRPPPAPPAPVAVPPMPSPYPPTPTRLVSGSISSDDYPAAAVRSRAEGSTRARLRIGENGRVTGCSVERSSGSSVLDSTTCALLQRRFRFRPATFAGRPVAADVVLAVTWRMPLDDLPMIALAPGRLTWTVTASAAGIATCEEAIDGAAFADFDRQVCAGSREDKLVEPAAMPAAPALQVRQVIELVPAADQAAAPPAPGAAWEAAATVQVSGEGKVTSCRADASRGTLPAFVRPEFGLLCDTLAGGRWFAPTSLPGQQARLRSLIYVRPAPQP